MEKKRFFSVLSCIHAIIIIIIGIVNFTHNYILQMYKPLAVTVLLTPMAMAVGVINIR